MIAGIGVYVTEVPRIAAMLERWGERFTRKVFTAGERAYAADKVRRAEHLAARFAAKEATLKALGVPEGLSWFEMEVITGARGGPELLLTGRALAAAQERGVQRLHLTLTHAAGIACAVVIAES